MVCFLTGFFAAVRFWPLINTVGYAMIAACGRTGRLRQTSLSVSTKFAVLANFPWPALRYEAVHMRSLNIKKSQVKPSGLHSQ